MSGVVLLDKTRKIGGLLHDNTSGKFLFNDVCRVLSEVLSSNVFVLSKKGKVLGIFEQSAIVSIDELLSRQVGSFIDKDLNERLLSVLSTKENVNLQTLGFASQESAAHQAIIVPIEIAGERLGSLFFYRDLKPYDIDDIILCEYGMTVVGLEMLRSVSEETEEERRKHLVVQSAIDSLSVSEQEAIVHVFDALGGFEGILVASKIADMAGITRSVIVNALRKLESAGVIEAKSSGMKGTYIKVLNDEVFDEVAKLKKNM